MAVYKDKKRGTWYTSFPYVDWTGKRCRKLKRGFLTKKEAQNWENHFKLQKANSLDMTFEDFYGIYETDVKPKIRYNTWCTKEHIIKTKILPYFKDLSMRDITPRDIIKWQNTMRESINNKGKEYTGTYLKTVQAQLSSIFNHAVRFYELPTNPVRVAGPMGQNESDEMKFWTKEEYMKFIPTMANKPYSYMAFELLYWCGIRLGELRALTPADFDFETNMLSITKSYQRIKGEDIITKPKTKRSIRKVIMPETVANEMKDFINSIYGITPDDRLFPISKSYLHHEMDRGVKESGVKRIRVHDLRHSHVSLSVLLIVILLVFSVLQPLSNVTDGIGNFLSGLRVENSALRNTTLTQEEIEAILLVSGADETQKQVLSFALSKVGYPYSQPRRTSGTAFDCSSLAFYAWQHAGVDISFGGNYPPTAASGAKMLNDAGKSLTSMDLKPGDLVYYGGSDNGRYLGIYHVAIYVGNGKSVEALNDTYGVVYQTLKTKNAVMVCRPNK